MPDVEIANQNKARNRRVEFFLFVPTRAVADLGSQVQPKVHTFDTTRSQKVKAAIDRAANKFTDIAGRSPQGATFMATAKVELDGPPGAAIGFLQILTNDIRQGVYRTIDGRRTLVLDYSRCVDVPCRDVEEATLPFNLVGPGRSANAPTGGPVDLRFNDSPGFIVPIDITESGDPHGPSGRDFHLDQTDWFMRFALMLGVRRGAEFMPLKHAVWSVTSGRTGISSGNVSGQPVVQEEAQGDGLAPGVSLSGAASLATCRAL